MRVKGAVAIVTGVGGSIGLAIANYLADHGAHVLGLDINLASIDGLNNLNFEKKICDGADPIIVSEIIKDYSEQHGRIDLLVNAAGWIASSPLFNLLLLNRDGKHDTSLWHKIFRSNIDTVFVMTSHVVEQMVKRRTNGLIINISSAVAKGNIGQSAYSAAKSGVESLTKTWALELGPLGIRSVCIAPGFIDTPSTKQALEQHKLEQWISRTALRRLGTVESIAHTVKYAIENEYLTGVTLQVDGGLII